MENFNDFRVVVGSWPDREDLVADIYYKEQHWLEVNQETGQMVIQAYAPYDQEEYWEFPFEDAIEALMYAKKRLIELRLDDKKYW